MSRVLLFGALLFLSACTPGWIYTDITSPFCTDMRSTPAGTVKSSSGLKSVNIPRIPGARTVWSSNSIGDAAKREGITQVEYCDREQFSVLGGIWGSDKIVVYGR